MIKKRLGICSLALAVSAACVTSFAQTLAPEQKASFKSCFDIAVVGLADGVALTNFPLSVRLSAVTLPTFDSSVMRDDGKDICFADAEDSLLSFETDTWNPEGESVYWVKVPVLTNGCHVLCYYGRKDAFENTTEQEVWADYTGVWHVNEAEAGEVPIANVAPSSMSMIGGGISTVLDAGLFGRARGSTTRGAQSVSCCRAPNDKTVKLGSSFTLSCWAKYAATGTAFFFAASERPNGAGWKFYSIGSNNHFVFAPGAEDTTGNHLFSTEGDVGAGLNVWRKIDLVCDGLQQSLYIDGTLIGTGTSSAEPTFGNYGFAVGGSAVGATYGFSCGAYFDEIHYSAGQRSADWIRAEYDASGLSSTPLVKYTANDIDAYCKTFKRYVDIAVNELDSGVVLTNFPLSVRLSSATVPGFNPAEMRSDGKDICFMTFEGEFLSFETDTWNPNGESVYWVRVPALTNGCHVLCYYGRSKAVPNDEAKMTRDVWAGYTGVWHVNESEDGVVTLDDASSNALDMTGGSLSTVSESGVFGRSRGSTSRGAVGISCGKIPVSEKSKFDLGSSFTMSAWVNFNAASQSYVFSASDRGNGIGWKFYVSGNSANQFYFSAGAENTAGVTVRQPFPDVGDAAKLNVWRKIDLVSDGLEQKLYMNGELVGTVTSPIEPTFGDYGLSVGGSAVETTYGLSAGAFFDEIHYSAGQRSAAWIRAEYRASGKAATSLLTYSRAQLTKPIGLIIILK